MKIAVSLCLYNGLPVCIQFGLLLSQADCIYGWWQSWSFDPVFDMYGYQTDEWLNIYRLMNTSIARQCANLVLGFKILHGTLTGRMWWHCCPRTPKYQTVCVNTCCNDQIEVVQALSWMARKMHMHADTKPLVHHACQLLLRDSDRKRLLASMHGVHFNLVLHNWHTLRNASLLQWAV